MQSGNQAKDISTLCTLIIRLNPANIKQAEFSFPACFIYSIFFKYLLFPVSFYGIFFSEKSFSRSVLSSSVTFMQPSCQAP